MPANMGESTGALLLFEKAKTACWSGKISLIWADEGFGGAEFESQLQLGDNTDS